MLILIKYFDEKMEEIAEIPEGNWIDLRAAETIVYGAGEAFKMPLGIAMQLPKGYEAHLLPRGSTFDKYGVMQTNSMGIIDEPYCGDTDEWKMPLIALRDGVIQKGDRIAQFRVMPIMLPLEFRKVDSLKNPSRGGFGSTGRK